LRRARQAREAVQAREAQADRERAGGDHGAHGDAENRPPDRAHRRELQRQETAGPRRARGGQPRQVVTRPAMRSANKAILVEAHRPRWSGTWVWIALAVAFLAVQAAVAASVLAGASPWLIAALLLVDAHVMHGHLLAFHEAAHGTLCPNQRLNDI